MLITPHPGIWMCRGHDMNVLVMDVEGTDGRERGEDQVSP
jgi:protein SEY1